MIQIRHTGAEDLIASLAPGSVSGVIADPPWLYSNASNQGGAAKEYDLGNCAWIASVIDSTWELCGKRAYLAVWCTWPKMADWFAAHDAMRWRYVTGGCWTKSNGRMETIGWAR